MKIIVGDQKLAKKLLMLHASEYMMASQKRSGSDVNSDLCTKQFGNYCDVIVGVNMTS